MDSLRRRSGGLTLSLMTLVAAGAWPAQADDTAQRLEQLRARIEVLQSELHADQGRYQGLQMELEAIEVRIGATHKGLRDLERDLEAADAALAELRRQEQASEAALADERRELAMHLRSAFVVGRQSRVKLVLSQEDPAVIGRALGYYAYLNRERVDEVRSLRAQLDTLAALQHEIRLGSQRLAGLKVEHDRERQRLEAEYRQRGTILAGLEAEIQAKGERLEAMVRDKATLEDLIARLHDVLTDIPAGAGQPVPMAEQKGRLPWPAAGRLTTRFGDRRPASDLTWQGVVIDTEAGTEVRAVSHGRVAYADWLRGFGLLMIIDHGDGFMTLYGYNQSLYRQVGDWVEAGEVIAGVGDTGGRTASGLYFEIRHRGRPVNPVSWCLSPRSSGRVG